MYFDAVYQSMIVPALYCLIVLITLSLWLIPWKKIMPAFPRVSKTTWALFIIILLLGSVLCFLVFPHYHMMYIDEPWYMEAAKNIQASGKPVICDYRLDLGVECHTLPKPIGWPFLLSIVLHLPFFKTQWLFFATAALGSLLIASIFILTLLIFRSHVIALSSSFLMAINPLFVQWSLSLESNTAAVFFFILAQIFFLLWIKIKNAYVLAAALLLFIFTVTIRYEFILLLLLFVMMYLIFLKKPNHLSISLRNYFSLILVGSMALVSIVTYVAGNHFRGYFSDRYWDYVFLNFFPFLDAVTFHFVLAIPAAYFFIRENDSRIRNALFACILLSFWLYIPFASESRMALVPLIFMLIASAAGTTYFFRDINAKLKVRRSILIFIFLFVYAAIFSLGLYFVHTLPQDEYRLKFLETQSAYYIADYFKENCTIIAEWPTIILSSSGLASVNTNEAIILHKQLADSLESGQCYYYYEDMYCQDEDFPIIPYSRQKCELTHKLFQMETYWEFNHANISYRLLNISGLRNVSNSINLNNRLID